ncbi:MAG: response regulator transcription factor [Oscillospiraceae bacterium]|nr:response regulator transcription factor [Oscillospiraceae bacterium]
MKALIIEDDKRIAYAISECVKDIFETDLSFNGKDGLEMAEQSIYDVIILDLMMPIMDGFQVLESLRKKEIETPVLILTARDATADVVKGLRIGADDYLIKPFKGEELLARCEAIVRRSLGGYKEKTIRFKDLKLNLQTRQAYVKEKTINLQGKQFDMLEYLIISKNSILTRNQIFNKIWGFNSFTTTNVVDVYASGIRKELKKYGYDTYFKTIRGIGYMLQD